MKFIFYIRKSVNRVGWQINKPYVDVWFGNVLGTCCNELLETYALGSLYTTACDVTALVAAIVLPPPAEAPMLVRLCMWWIGGTPMGTLGICKFEKSSSALSLEFSVLEVNALISLPENCLLNLALYDLNENSS
jgi:hypothetical protein